MCVKFYVMFEPSEFFHYLQRPYYQFAKKRNGNTYKIAIKIYFVYLLFFGLFNFLISNVLGNLINLPVDQSFTVPKYLQGHLWLFFLLVGFFSPFFEEIIFRLSLIFNPIYASLSISTLIALIARKMTSSFIFPILLFILISVFVYSFTNNYKSQFQSFWNKYFKYIFYFSSLLFGLVHVSNFEYISVYQYFIAPVLVFPQLAMGFILSFTRMFYKNGFLICFLFHVLLNSFAVSVFLLKYSH